MNNGCECQYKYLGPWRGSNYKQFFYKERKIRALTLYQETQEPDARSPEEVAADHDVPVEAVLEAIHYCTHNQELIKQEADEELASIRARGWDKPPHVPPWYKAEA